MENSGEYRAVEFKSPADIWPVDTGDAGRDDQYITVKYDVTDGTYSLTYHPSLGEWTAHHFTAHHAVLALRDVGYSFPQISRLLEETYKEAHAS